MQLGVINTVSFFKDHKLHELQLAADHPKGDPAVSMHL